MQVRMNSWKRSLFGAGAGAGAGPGAGAGAGPGARASGTGAGLGVRRLTEVLLSGGMVETKRRAKTKQEEFPCLPNGLAEPLGKSF